MRDIPDAKIKQKILIDKSAVPGFINKYDLNKKVETFEAKAKLKTE